MDERMRFVIGHKDGESMSLCDWTDFQRTLNQKLADFRTNFRLERYTKRHVLENLCTSGMCHDSLVRV